MNELGQIIETLAIQSYRYNTFRGKWTDMPDSTWLCVLLGVASTASGAFLTYLEYGLAMALAVPGTWLAAAWVFTDSWKPNRRLLSAFFLTTILPSCLMMLVGRGHPYIEVIVGVYTYANILTIKTRD